MKNTNTNSNRAKKSYSSYVKWMIKDGLFMKPGAITLTRRQYITVKNKYNAILRISHNTPREIAKICGTKSVSVTRILKNAAKEN